MSDIKQKARDVLKAIEDDNNSVSGNAQIVKTATRMSDIYNLVDSIIDQAIQEDRERIIKLIKEKGLHLGYANDIINIIREN